MSAPAGVWGLRAVALVLAFLAWALITIERLEPESEKVLTISIRYDVPDNFVLVEPPESARVKVRGKATSLRSLNPFQVEVFVPLDTAQKGTYSVQLTEDNVTVPEDVQIISIDPTRLDLELDLEITKMMPVKPALTGEPAAGAITQEATASPESVLVRGPESRIRSLESLSTTPISLDTHAIDFEVERARVICDDPTIQLVGRDEVRVRVRLLVPSAGEGGTR